MPDLAQETWQSLMDNAPNIIIVIDRGGTIQYVNRTVPGIRIEDVIGKNHFDYIEPGYRDIVRETTEQVFRTGEPGQYEIEGTGPEGTTSWYSTAVGPIKSNGEVAAVSLFVSDVSERKMAEEALRRAKDELLAKQSEAIMELSTPVIPIWDEIIVLPLIGTIDTPRAQQIMENLLDSIVKTQASVAIIDITGVAVVDTSVANHFLRSIAAAKLLGTEVIVTGVSPNNAQTLVKLGVDLSLVTTRGSLQSGLEMAFEKTGHKVTREK